MGAPRPDLPFISNVTISPPTLGEPIINIPSSLSKAFLDSSLNSFSKFSNSSFLVDVGTPAFLYDAGAGRLS